MAKQETEKSIKPLPTQKRVKKRHSKSTQVLSQDVKSRCSLVPSRAFFNTLNAKTLPSERQTAERPKKASRKSKGEEDQREI